MPQLNPSPWFMIFLLIWMTFFILLTKVLKTHPKPTLTQYHHQPYTDLWTWPWP
uniref:ATP synthase complex subunit 8 n=1 Tax=Eremias multiocellata TaxID=383862 RepID=A0A089QGD1_9SAUR|nr:ATP synthase F0 subunit 8 [Eremias multiocellata]AIR12491.1 ATP synthase F0 subunit 8 [Eremias multiocellata]